jgi:hypothetical protein
MRKVNGFLPLILTLFLSTYGCALLGPSEADVLTALEASIRSFQASMVKENLELHEVYDNAVDIAFINGDRSLLHNMSVMRKDKKIFISGECIFAEYVDIPTQYYINGNISYHLRFPRNLEAENAKAGSGKVTCKIILKGGRIENLNYVFTINTNGVFDEFAVAANGKNIDMRKYRQQLNFIKFMQPLTRG